MHLPVVTSCEDMCASSSSSSLFAAEDRAEAHARSSCSSRWPRGVAKAVGGDHRTSVVGSASRGRCRRRTGIGISRRSSMPTVRSFVRTRCLLGRVVFCPGSRPFADDARTEGRTGSGGGGGQGSTDWLPRPRLVGTGWLAGRRSRSNCVDGLSFGIMLH